MLGWTYKCKPAGDLDSAIDANNYVYIILQRGAKDFELACQAFGFEDWLTNPDFNTADARDKHKDEIYQRIGAWTADKTKFEVTELRQVWCACRSGALYQGADVGRVAL